MINISAHQIIQNMPYTLVETHNIISKRLIKTKFELECSKALNNIFITVGEIEKKTQVYGILTSNKLWELLVACELKHNLNPDQKKYDAYDKKGRTYEYKVNIKPHWTFQDISDNVLESYLNNKEIILAVVDKRAFAVKKIVSCKPKAIKEILEKKLNNKKEKALEIRRLTASIGKKDINEMIEKGNAKWIL